MFVSGPLVRVEQRLFSVICILMSSLRSTASIFNIQNELVCADCRTIRIFVQSNKGNFRTGRTNLANPSKNNGKDRAGGSRDIDEGKWPVNSVKDSWNCLGKCCNFENVSKLTKIKIQGVTNSLKKIRLEWMWGNQQLLASLAKLLQKCRFKC